MSYDSTKNKIVNFVLILTLSITRCSEKENSINEPSETL